MKCKVCNQHINIKSDGDIFAMSAIWECACGKTNGARRAPPPAICGGAIDGVCPEPEARGSTDCAQDCCENAPFACIGGLGWRSTPIPARWICAEHREAWLRGYLERARDLYGDDWRTCSFGWKPAITVNSEDKDSGKRDE